MEREKQKANCPVSARCGGCTMAGESYEAHLKGKQEKAEALFHAFCAPSPIVAMEDPFHYRCKVHRVVSAGKHGEIFSGNYEALSHRVVPVRECLIEDRLSQRVIDTVVRLASSFRLKPYDEDKRTGFIRHVLVRRGYRTGELLVILVASTGIFPGKTHFVKALREAHPEITTAVLNVNGRDTSAVLGPENHTLFGPGFIYDRIGSLKYRLSPSAFYQVNPLMTEKLYEKVASFAALTGKETVIDAYCGVGTIGLYLAKQARNVIGVELNLDAVRDAVQNARLNHVENARFFAQDATAFLCKMASSKETADVVILDPPRSGSTEAFIDAVAKLSPSKVVYVSCGPETLSRDLSCFGKRGYRAAEIVPMDMFPWTEHMESCVLLERVSNRKADSYVKLNVKMEDYYRMKDAEGGETNG